MFEQMWSQCVESIERQLDSLFYSLRLLPSSCLADEESLWSLPPPRLITKDMVRHVAGQALGEHSGAWSDSAFAQMRRDMCDISSEQNAQVHKNRKFENSFELLLDILTEIQRRIEMVATRPSHVQAKVEKPAKETKTKSSGSNVGAKRRPRHKDKKTKKQKPCFGPCYKHRGSTGLLKWLACRREGK